MTLPTYEEALARAHPGSPFSNGTEGQCWMAANCERCVNDKPHRDGSDPKGCPLILVAYEEKTPSEWLEQPRDEQGRIGLYDRYHCMYFRDEDNPGPDEPTPIPDPPGQDALFPRDEFERPARMYADTMPREVPAHA